jgi:tryptophan synthase alpha chain
MNRIDTLFQQKNNNILSIYFTAGHPTLDSTSTIINTLASEGVDMIEIGIPFSDPVADGPVIQCAYSF